MKKQKRITCPYCGSRAILQKGSYVHGEKSKEEYLYVCSKYPKCNSYVGVHKGTKIAKGVLADPQLRHKRICAHRIFDTIWKRKLMTKKEAYRWMEYAMGIPSDMAHIAGFSDYRCDELMQKCSHYLKVHNIEVPIGA